MADIVKKEETVVFLKRNIEATRKIHIVSAARQRRKRKRKAGYDSEQVTSNDDDADEVQWCGCTWPDLEFPPRQPGTFIVIAKRFKRNTIFRFSAANSFFLFSPWNPMRRLSVYIATNQFFDYFVMLTILVNCVFLALNESTLTKIAEYVFLAIYTVEMVIKIIARGFIVHRFTYLRDGWNWLDFFVIFSAYLTIVLESFNALDIGSVAGLRTFRVFRILKTVSIIPDLKTIIGALLKAMRMILEVIILTSFCMVVFALFGLQVYLGVLRQKCVRDPVYPISDYDYDLHIKNATNWFIDQQDQYFICGNISGAGNCPNNFTCLPDIGENPNWGYSSFDHFGWAMLNSFQLITLDFWEDPYNKVIHANGPWNIIFFIFVVFFGSFYLLNLMLAVVSMSYEEEAKNAGKDPLEQIIGSATTTTTSNIKKSEKEKETERKFKKDEAERNKKRNDDLKKDKDAHDEKVEKSAENDATATLDKVVHIDEGGVTSHKQKRNDRMKQQATTDSGMGSDDKIDVVKTEDKDKQKEISGDVKDKNLKPPKIKIRENDDVIDEKSSDNNDKKKARSWDEESDIDSDEDTDDELVDRNCEVCSRCCKCYIPWLRIQKFLFRIASDFMFEMSITFCIILNTLIMAMEHHGMNDYFVITLAVGNYTFTGIFIAEAIIKICASSKLYFKSAWNLFDLFVVIASIIDLGLENIDGLGVIKTFRLLRLLRVFKLAQTWATMRMLLQIILNTIGALGNLTLILGIVIYIFAVIGMQLFRDSYATSKFYPDPKPRWNFDDFGHATILVFRILCGEWIEPLWDCMRAAGEMCMIVFMPTLILGNFMVLSLFLALLLNSFASDSLRNEKDSKEDSRMKQGWKKIQALFKKKTVEPGDEEKPKKLSVADIAEALRNNRGLVPSLSITDVDQLPPNGDITPTSNVVDELNYGGHSDEIDSNHSPANGSVRKDSIMSNQSSAGTLQQPGRQKSKLFLRLQKIAQRQQSENADDDNIEEANENEENNSSKNTPRSILELEEEHRKQLEKEEEDEQKKEKIIHNCCPAICYTKISFCKKFENPDYFSKWHKLRQICFIITENKIFEYTILFLIMASSISLCFEDIYLPDKPILKDALFYLNIIFAALFTLEMVLKWIAIGYTFYFTHFWTLLDFAIVVITILSLTADSVGGGAIGSLKSLRTLRALRPLRAISRWQGMRIVVNALMFAIPAIFNVLCVCMVFWLVFSIAGVQLFAGKFYRCVDANDNKILNTTYIPDKETCLAQGLRWRNAPIHFDNVLQGYLALFQVATFEGWMEVMEDGVDATEVDKQPKFENNMANYTYFVVFIVVGSFFTLNLFIGVIIDNFNMLKKKYEGSYLDMFLTSSQKNYMNTMKKLGNKKPQKTIKRPKNRVQAFIFDVAVSTKFELAVVLLILLNMACMAVEHYRQNQSVTDALEVINLIFVTIFVLEAAVKIFGLRWHYFRRAWNVFDFIIVVLSLLGVVLSDILQSIFINPTLLRVVRVFRIGRVLRLIKVAKGIRKLLFALVISLPALFNIFMLLFLIMFIYAIFGMGSFGKIKPADHVDDIMNFQTFPNAILLLFRLTTAAGWNDAMYPMLNAKPPDCNDTHWQMPNGTWIKESGGNCSNSFLAVAFMVSYIFITYLIIINMYIAIILENFHQAHEQEEVGITEDDFDMFYVVWEKYDPHATQFIKYEHLSDFVGDIDPPLGIAKPNEIALVSFDLPIVEGDRLHCLDILIALVRRVLGEVEVTNEFQELKGQMESKFKEQFPTRVQFPQQSTTMKRKKEDVAARTLQRAWKKHKAETSIRLITQMALEAKKGALNQSYTNISLTAAQRRASKMSTRLQLPVPAEISLPSENSQAEIV